MKNKHLSSDCNSCPHYAAEGLKKMGTNTVGSEYLVALAGNPNTGKSTVFNALTGLKQHTGNWPGKTVAKAEGAYHYGQNKYQIIDLPGTYSLLSTSDDEEIARNFLLFGQPDVTVIVVDATRLERNLNLVLQILEINTKCVLCLNLIDEAARHHITIDERQLSRDLGIPVVPASARFQRGIPELLKTIEQIATGHIKCTPRRIKHISKDLETAVNTLDNKLKEEFPNLTNSRWIAFRMLEGDKQIIEALENNNLV